MSTSAETTARPIETAQSNLELAVLVVLGVPLLLTAGPLAIGIWLATLLAWYALDTPTALATGFVGLAAVPTYTLEGGTALLAPVAYVLVALAAGFRTAHPFAFGVTVAVTASGLVGVSWLLIASGLEQLWMPGLVLLGVLGLCSLALDRYERLAIGLLEGTADRNSPTGDTTDGEPTRENRAQNDRDETTEL